MTSMSNRTTIIEFHPETGSVKPWELWNPEHSHRLGSFKTEAAANKKKKIFDDAISSNKC